MEETEINEKLAKFKRFSYKKMNGDTYYRLDIPEGQLIKLLLEVSN